MYGYFLFDILALLSKYLMVINLQQQYKMFCSLSSIPIIGPINAIDQYVTLCLDKRTIILSRNFHIIFIVRFVRNLNSNIEHIN